MDNPELCPNDDDDALWDVSFANSQDGNRAKVNHRQCVTLIPISCGSAFRLVPVQLLIAQ